MRTIQIETNNDFEFSPQASISGEGYKIEVTTQEENGTDRELDLISISLPGGLVWKGTVQCLLSIPNIVGNALSVMGNLQIKGVSNEEYDNLQDSFDEMTNLLDHFSKTDAAGK